MCDIMTDNRNRTAPEMRKVFELNGGKLGSTGCVAYLFDRKGLIVIPAENTDEEQLMDVALESGADDVKQEGDNFEVTCEPEAYADLLLAIEEAGFEPTVKQVTRIPNSTVDLDAKTGKRVLRLMEALDDHDDVQSVSANFNLADDVMADISGE